MPTLQAATHVARECGTAKGTTPSNTLKRNDLMKQA